MKIRSHLDIDIRSTPRPIRLAVHSKKLVLSTVVLSFAAVASLTAQTRGTYVVRSGFDTVSVERFVRSHDRLTGEIETRVAGRTSRVTYSILKDASGRPVRLEYSLTVPQMGLSTAALDVGPDSAIGPVMLSERESFFRGVLPNGAVPLLYPLSIAMLEDLVRSTQQRNAAEEDARVFVWGNQRPMGAATRKVSRVDANTFDVPEMNGLRLIMNDKGELMSGSGRTANVAIVRAPAQSPIVNLHGSPAAPGSAATPPMGWNSWNKFGCRIDETLIRETADALVSSGMLAAGYRYLNIDDCWEARARAANGELAVDSVRFPSGMKALVDYVHGKGLKVGIYSSGGTGTCQGRPATLDHEVEDARTFARWEIDYVKYDNCNARNRPEQVRFKAMIDAVKAAGRNTVFSICEWGEARPWLWGRQLGGQLWRTTEDIRDSWLSMIGILDQQVGLEAYAGPDGWNDPDMLEVGNGKMTHDEYVAHFSLWALLNAPLIAGNDVRSMDESTRAILMNRDVIAVDQDWGGRQGYRLRDDGAGEVWVKPMSDGGWAVVLLNRGSATASIQLRLAEFGMKSPWWKRIVGMSDAHRAKDLWSNQTADVRGTLSRDVPAHGAVMLRIN
jgi:alpha-galactosidase